MSITENIDVTLVTAVKTVLSNFYLAEAQTEAYPYGVYDINKTSYATKDGIYKWTADVTIHVYDKSASNAKSKADSIITAIATAMSGPAYFASMTSRSSDCSDKVYDEGLVYKITQKQ